jgi:hypothetical protein
MDEVQELIFSEQEKGLLGPMYTFDFCISVHGILRDKAFVVDRWAAVRLQNGGGNRLDCCNGKKCRGTW